MKIYLYDEKTLEYKETIEADADPEETKLQGHFVPLVPANATLIALPEFNENEIPVFTGNSWVVYPDFRENFYKVNENLSVEMITNIGIPEGAIVVSKDIGEEIKNNSSLFKVQGHQVIRKTEAEIAAEEVILRETKLRTEFFRTSLGYVRRKVNMKDGSEKDFLSDILPRLKAGVPILTYNEDFEQKKVIVTDEFISECDNQLMIDFYGE